MKRQAISMALSLTIGFIMVAAVADVADAQAQTSYFDHNIAMKLTFPNGTARKPQEPTFAIAHWKATAADVTQETKGSIGEQQESWPIAIFDLSRNTKLFVVATNGPGTASAYDDCGTCTLGLVVFQYSTTGWQVTSKRLLIGDASSVAGNLTPRKKAPTVSLIVTNGKPAIFVKEAIRHVREPKVTVIGKDNVRIEDDGFEYRPAIFTSTGQIVWK